MTKIKPLKIVFNSLLALAAFGAAIELVTVPYAYREMKACEARGGQYGTGIDLCFKPDAVLK